MLERKAMFLGLALALVGVGVVWGQPGGGRGNVVNIDGVRTQMGATEEEWKVISPMILKIIAGRQAITVAQNGGVGAAGGMGGGRGPGGGGNGSFSGPGDSAAGNMGGGGPGGGGPGGFGPGGGGNGPGNGAGSGVAAATTMTAVSVVDAAAVAAEDAKVKEAATTKAIKKANADIEATQKELQELLTTEEQAVAVKLGYLAK